MTAGSRSGPQAAAASEEASSSRDATHGEPPIRITDFHIHIQPWRSMKPAVMETMRRGKEEHFDFLIAVMEDPKLLLQIMDEQGIDRVGMVNYPSPNIMGFGDDTNDFSAHKFCGQCPDWRSTRWPDEGRSYADMMEEFRTSN